MARNCTSIKRGILAIRGKCQKGSLCTCFDLLKELRRYLNRLEKIRGIEIVLAGCVDDSQHASGSRLAICEHFIDFQRFEIDVSAVFHADDEAKPR